MHSRHVYLLAGVGLLFCSTSLAVEPETANGPQAGAVASDEWAGKPLLAKAPTVTVRERPHQEAPIVPFSLTGIWLYVDRVDGDWLKVDVGWIRIADVVPEDGAVDYFTSQLAQGENAFFYLGRARGWLKQLEFDKSQADVSEAQRLDPRNARAFFVRAKICEEQQRRDEELANYDRAVELDPRDPIPVAERGRIWAQRGNYDRAIADLDAAIALRPTAFYLWTGRGWCRLKKGDYDRALADCAEAIQRKPGDAYAFSLRAAIFLRRREYDEALLDAAEAIRLDPKMAYGYAVRGEALAAQGKLDEALTDFDESIRLDARDSQPYVARGRVHLLKRQYDKAVLDLSQAIALQGGSAELYYNRAAAWANLGDSANAIVDFGECLKLEPQVVEAYVHRGELRIDSSLDEALEDFQAALRVNPRHVGALINRADVWSRKDESQKALDDLAAAISINPNESEAYRQRAEIHTSRREFDAAIEDLTAGIRAEPRKTACLLDRAMAFALKGEHQKAIDDCHAVLKIEPNNKIAYSHLAVVYSWGDKHDEALEAYSALLRIDPDDADALMSRGNVAVGLGKFDVALADFERLMGFEEHKAGAYRSRGQLWSRQRQWEKALADFNDAIRLKPDDDFALCHRAHCWIALKQFDKAIHDADEALRLDPKSDFAASVRRQATEAKKNPSRAFDPLAPIVGCDTSLTVEPTEPLVPSYYINLQGPAGFKLAIENFESEDFGPQVVTFPHRQPMFDEGMSRFRLVGTEAGVPTKLYLRIESARVSPENAVLLAKTVPSLAVTNADLHKASSGAHVTKVLVLVRSDGGHPTEPEFEVLSGTETRAGAELLAEAARRGTVIAALDLSERLPPLLPLLHSTPDDRFVRFQLGGPKGLRLAYESGVAGKFDKHPLPFPAQFSRLPGFGMRFELSGPVVPANGQLHGWVMASTAWPAELGPPGRTELQINLTSAAVEAAAAGKCVTYVAYMAEEAKGHEAPSIQTLDSTRLDPSSDPVAEASRRGTILATVKLNKDFGALPPTEPGFEPGSKITEQALERLVRFCLGGPKGLVLTDDPPLGPFGNDARPMPAQIGLPPGLEMQFKLSGPPVAGGCLYALLTPSAAWPAELGAPGKTELKIDFSKANLDAAAAGKSVTLVVYLAKNANEPESPRIETLDSTKMDPAIDPVAEASRRGAILATIKLSKKLSGLPPPTFDAAATE